MHGILSIKNEQLLRGKLTLSTVYNIILVFILFVKVIPEQQLARSLLNSSLKPPFSCATGAKDLQANIIVIIRFLLAGAINLFLVLVF